MIDRAPTAEDARDLLAAEYVLGLTEPADLPQVEAFIMRDSGFAAAVASWRARLAPLDSTASPATIDDRTWTGIEAALNEEAPLAAAAPAERQAQAQSRPQAPAPSAQTVPPIVPTPAIEPRAPTVSRPSIPQPSRQGFLAGLWNSLGFWRFAGLSGAFAAMLLAAGLGYVMREANRQPVLIAVLMSEGNQAAAVVNAFADGRADLLPLVDIQVPEGKAIEIWTLWDRAVGPRSIGLIQRAGRTTLKLEGLPRPKPGQIFEMTLESASGSPTGRPTGPVLNKGEATTAL